MANITVRKQNGGTIQPRTEWEPARLMRDLLRWDPFREMMPSFPSLPQLEVEFTPAFEVKETKDGYLFTADVPGVEEKDIEVTLTGNRLSVSGKREAAKEEKGDNYYTCERSYGSFLRTFTLPQGADPEHVKAELRNGVLSLVVPKMPEAQPKKISIKSEAKH